MSAAASRVTFHCGLPKTGSTFLQAEVFPRATNGAYVSGKALFSTILDVLCADHPHVLVSEERLGWTNLRRDDFRGRRRQRKLAYLARTWQGAQLLLFLREPSEMVRSHYAQYLHDGGTEDFAAFRKDFVHPEEFQHERLLDDIDKMGWHDVLLLEHADLLKRPQWTIGMIETFTGLRFPGWSPVSRATRNMAVSGHGARLLRLGNRLAIRLSGVAGARELPPRAAMARRQLRRWIQGGWLSSLNGLGAPVVPTECLQELRAAYAGSWAGVRRRIEQSQVGRTPQ